MKIISAEYIKSFTSIHNFDLPLIPAVAFIGRSNVGKSSLINNLLNRKKLVKTSSSPGKTRLINFFLINGSFYFVDLPGYGFAEVPVQIKNSWQNMIHDFLYSYPKLKLIIQLVDIRRTPNQGDVDFQKLLQSIQLPNLVIASKGDKVNKTRIQKALDEIRIILSLPQSPLLHSTLRKIGKDSVWGKIIPHLEDLS